MARVRFICFTVILSFLNGACSSRSSTFASRSDPSAPAFDKSPNASTMPAAPTAPTINGEVASTQEDDADGPDDESDVAETEPVEGTPSDLGDVQASGTLRDDEIRADILSRRTFPLVDNEFVEQWIQYFTGRGRGAFTKWLQRSPRYRPLIQRVMKKDGLPEDLVYLAMIESGFNPIAKSRAKAVGPWQFIKSTGQRYGLVVDSWIDERREIEKSTHAAAKYLKELHQIFGSWYLAAASYNAGEGKVLNAVRHDKSRNFWELARTKKNFRSETRNYVPKIIAAALISKNPEKYGFTNLDYEDNLTWENVTVPGRVDLRAISLVTGIDKAQLKLLNAELKRGCTPPNRDSYEIRVPAGTKDKVLAQIDQIRAKKYKPEDDEPVRSRRRHRTRVARNGAAPSATVAAAVAAGSYRVQRGDTLWALAKKFGTSVSELKRLNAIRSKRDFREGIVIKLPSTKSARN